MSILKIAAIPFNVHPARNAVRTTLNRGRSESLGWSTLLADGYPAVGLLLIAGYLLWTLCLGESTLPWVGELSAAD